MEKNHGKISLQPSSYRQVEYRHSFTRIDCPGRGVGFECDKNGNISEKHLTYFNECLKDPNLRDNGIKEISWMVYKKGKIQCECGSLIELYSYWANSCTNPKCNNEYDADGGLLVPREFWGEETGEVF